MVERSSKVPTGQDGAEIRAEAASHLEYLAGLAKELGVVDPVETYFDPVVGRWTDMHREAELWRAAAKAAKHVSDELGKPLGTLDAGWEGKDADAFVAYIGAIGLAGTDAEDALNAMAAALDETASALRQICLDMADLLMDTAEVTSESVTLPTGGEERARSQLSEAKHSARLLYESARTVLEAFGKLCDGVEDGDPDTGNIEMAHHYPADKFQLTESGESAASGGQTSPVAAETTGTGDTPHGAGTAASPGGSPSPGEPLEVGRQTAAAVPTEVTPGVVPDADQGAAARSGQGASMGGMGMMPMGMGMGAGQGGDREHKVKTRAQTEPVELFGKPDEVAPPVIGKDD